MKRLMLCSYATFFIIIKMFATDIIGTINNNGEISGSNKFVNTFWSNPDVTHDVSSYVEKYKMTINTNDGHYLLRLYRHTEIADKETIDDIDTFGDVFFSKLDIEYYNKNGVKVNSNTILNDGLWFKYNYWTFATYTDNPWKETRDITVYVVDLTEDCKALVLRGERDSIDSPLLTVLMLYQGKSEIVFNKPVEINAVSSDVNRTIFDVQEIKYDSKGKLIPKQYKIVFENGGIVVI